MGQAICREIEGLGCLGPPVITDLVQLGPPGSPPPADSAAVAAGTTGAHPPPPPAAAGGGEDTFFNRPDLGGRDRDADGQVTGWGV